MTGKVIKIRNLHMFSTTADVSFLAGDWQTFMKVAMKWA